MARGLNLLYVIGCEGGQIYCGVVMVRVVLVSINACELTICSMQ